MAAAVASRVALVVVAAAAQGAAALRLGPLRTTLPQRCAPPHLQLSPPSTSTPIADAAAPEHNPSSPIPGVSDARDDETFRADPLQFCRTRISQYGGVFAARAAGASVFVGDSTVLSAISAADVTAQPHPALGPPLEGLVDRDGAATFTGMAEAFNAECYATLFNWIPLYKEEGGFGTFKFDDFIDRRVRRVAPSARRLLFRSLAPLLLGSRLDDWPEQKDFTSAADWEKAYAAYAMSLSNEAKGGAAPAFPFGLGKLVGGAADSRVLKPAIAQAVAAAGGGGIATAGLEGLATEAAGDVILRRVASTVEPAASLLCSMIVRAHRQSPTWAAALAKEREEALAGQRPDAPISAELLEAMPLLDAFTRETLRLAPPSRPPALRLNEDVVAGGFRLPAGSVVGVEPFVGHFLPDVYANAYEFEPERFMGDRMEPTPSLAFAGEWRETPSAVTELLIDIVKVCFVQMHRMFEVNLSQDVPESSGFPVRVLPDACEMLLKPGMYYELKRGTRKLKF